MQTNKLPLLLLVCFQIFGVTFLSAQDLGTTPSTPIPATKDSLVIPTIDLAEILPEQPRDSIKNDTLPKKQEMLADIVDYYGEDYVFLHRKENRVYMYNKAYIIYEDMRIDAGEIILDYNKNEVYAKGIKDSLGEYSQLPVFVQGDNTVKPDSIRFNFDTERALVFNSRTKQGEINIKGEITKKENDSVVFMNNVRFTTSKDIDNPEYYFFARKVKFVPKKKIVTGLTNMFIADVPTPLGLPFGFFPLGEDRASGFIIPTIGENNNRGFFFQNGGYYFNISDYVDLTVLGDYYTNGSYGTRLESNYALRYRFQGNVNFRYEKLINSERGFPDYSEESIYNIQLTHRQDAKANPSSNLSASVNLGSSSYYQRSINQLNTSNFLNNSLSSSINYSKTFEGEPQVNLSVAATHQQNTQTGEIDMSLPNITTSVSRIFPFAPKTGIKKGIIENINLQYDVRLQNRMQANDTTFFKPEMFNNAQMGMRHTIPVTTNFKILNYLSASMGGTYQETWSMQTTEPRFDEELNQPVRDTINGFDTYRTYDFSASLGTTVYGMFTSVPGEKIETIRHTMRPSVSYSVSPGFEQYWDELRYTPTVAGGFSEEEILEYSRFERTLFGAPGNRYSSSLGFSLSNNLEAKVKDTDSTATEPKKITLLNNLNFSASYNMAADSLQWSPLNITGSIPIVEKLDFNFNGALDPYALNSANRRINTYNIDNGGSLFRLTNANVSMNYSFSSRDFQQSDDDDDSNENSDTYRSGGRKDDLFGSSDDISNPTNQRRTQDNDEEEDVSVERYNYSIPWDLRLAYTVTYSNQQRQNEISSHSLMFSGNIDLSPRWSVGASSGYDIKEQGFTFTQLRFQRDLESWQMSFNWVPFSARSSWYFFIGIKSSIFSDIKYDKRREPDQRL